jgi:uroporphyrinogen-III decarboxylase
LVVPDAGAATAGLMPTYRKPLLDTPEAVEVFIRRLPPVDDATIRDMRDTVAAWAGAVGDDGILAPWGWAGVFNFAADLCGMETVMMAPYTDETAYHALMDALASAMAAYNEPLALAGADMIGLQGHIAGGASVSPEYFDAFVAPYEKRVMDAIHAAGAFSVYHNCGYARNLYPQYRALGMTLWETVAEPPRGDNSLAEAKRELGDAICLCGNLDQVEFLKTATPAEVAERTRQVVETGKPGGRYMFACADFIERGTPRANVEAMLAAARDAGKY